MKSDTGVAAVDRAFSVLSVFDEEGAAMTLAGLSSRTGLYKSTILRLLDSLMAAGMVHRDADGPYSLGPTALRLGQIYQRSAGLERTLLPIMKDLVAQGSESPSLHVRKDREHRICVLRVDSDHSTLDRVRAGTLRPLDRGAAGHVLRAFGEEAEPTEVRIAGLATSLGETEADCAGVSAPVFGTSAKLFGALSLSGPRLRFEGPPLELQQALVCDGAARMSRALGAPL